MLPRFVSISEGTDPMARGRSLPLSPARRWMSDSVHFGQKMPLISFERRMQLAPLAAARAACPVRPGWCALLIKAAALVAVRRPELRRAYLPFPRPRLYEHPFNVAIVSVERQDHGEPIVIPTKIHRPERLSVFEIDALLQRYRTEPLEQFSFYRRLRRTARLPTPLRRLVWRLGLSLCGSKRAKWFGTCNISVTAGLGAAALQLLGPTAPLFWYAPLQPSGAMDVRMAFDHRVLDGASAARALADLEETLLGEVAAELTPPDAAYVADDAQQAGNRLLVQGICGVFPKPSTPSQFVDLVQTVLLPRTA